MVPQRACFRKNNHLRLILFSWFLNNPIVNLDAAFAIVEADGIRILKYNELLLETTSSSICLTHEVAGVFFVVVFIPIKINTFWVHLFKGVVSIEECNFHIMRKYEDCSQYMIVIIIPNVFIGKLNFWWSWFNVNYFEAFLFEISEGEEFVINAERFSVSADCTFYCHM